MQRIHIVGKKNSGKTTLVVDLVAEYVRRGLRVGTIKHTHHQHELDTPGKDSHRHREAGAAAVGILSRGLSAIFWPPRDHEPADSRYDAFAASFADCRLVLVEGDLHTPAPKIEVWRAENQSRPYAENEPSIRAIVTDDHVSLAIPTWARADVAALADRLLELY